MQNTVLKDESPKAPECPVRAWRLAPAKGDNAETQYLGQKSGNCFLFGCGKLLCPALAEHLPNRVVH